MSATINLLSGQQADIESTDLSGFIGGTGVTLARDLTRALHGASSLKCVTDGSGTFQQVEARVPVAGQFTAGGAYTLSAYLYSVAGGPTLRFYCQSSSGSIGTVGSITLKAGWNRYSIGPVTLPNPITATYFALRWDTGGTAQAVTLWMDCLQFQAGVTLTPWVPGGAIAGPLPYMAYISSAPVDVVANTLHVETAIGARSTGGLTAWGPLGVVWSYGTQFQLYDDAGALAYSGYVTKDKAYKDYGSRQGTGVLRHDLTLMDNTYRADKRRVFKTYLLQTAGFIVLDLLGSYLAQEGVMATATSIATGPTITEVIWSGTKSVSDALTWLAQQAGYWWQIDVNGVLWFQPYGGIPAPFVMDGTMADSMQDMAVERGNDMYVNKQYAKGGRTETGVLVETFHGNGNTRSFTLSYPVSRLSGYGPGGKKSGTPLSVVLNSVDVTAKCLTKGSSGGTFYYAKGDAVLAQDPSQTILGSGDTLVVTYVGQYPVIASAQNPALIVAQQAREGGGTGLVESTYVNAKVHTLAAAFQIASALLSHYGQDTTVLTFSTRQKGLLPGQMLTVNLPDFALANALMLISGVTIDDQGPDSFNIWYRVTAVGSPIEAAQWQTYWQNLMNQSSDPTDLSDTADTSLALLSSTTVTRTPTVTVTQLTVQSPICGVTSGAHTMVCGNWKCS